MRNSTPCYTYFYLYYEFIIESLYLLIMSVLLPIDTCIQVHKQVSYSLKRSNEPKPKPKAITCHAYPMCTKHVTLTTTTPHSSFPPFFSTRCGLGFLKVLISLLRIDMRCYTIEAFYYRVLVIAFVEMATCLNVFTILWRAVRMISAKNHTMVNTSMTITAVTIPS